MLAVEDLAAAADAVAIIEPQGSALVHWNSIDGREWTSGDAERPAYIYSDERVDIVDVLAGTLTDKSLVLRTPGGRVDDVTMTFENAPTWQTGGRYLVFLDLAETPAEAGVESFWSILWMDRGLFRSDVGGAWRNDAARLVIEDAARFVSGQP